MAEQELDLFQFAACHATNARCQLRTQEARVSRFVRDAPNGSQAKVDRGRCETAVGTKTDNNASEFYRTALPPRVPQRSGRA
jgi:hypothetical protein